MSLPIIRPSLGGTPLDSADQQTLIGVTGQPVATVLTAPPLLVSLCLRRLGRTDDTTVPAGLFSEAGKRFATEVLEGLTPQEYCRAAASASGVPAGVYLRALDGMQAELEHLDAVASRPAATSSPGPPGIDAVVCRVPRGRVLTVICPSNHPEPHITWVRGLAAGYRVLVRPGSGDPFTPSRLAAALAGAGLPGERVAVLPSTRATADLLVRSADRAIVYGGLAAVRRWSGNPSVLVRGPGFSKALLAGSGPATETLLAHLADAVAGDGGVRCTNLSVIRTASDPQALAQALATRLATLPIRPVTDPKATLPGVPAAVAESVRDQLDGLLADGLVDESGYADGSFATASDGALIARPIVLSAPAGVKVPQVELPFPFVIVAHWQTEHGLEPLRDSLVLNLLAEPGDAGSPGGTGSLAQAHREPSIRKVVHGEIPPWSTAPGLPHDGSLDDFLSEPKTILGKSIA